MKRCLKHYGTEVTPFLPATLTPTLESIGGVVKIVPESDCPLCLAERAAETMRRALASKSSPVKL